MKAVIFDLDGVLVFTDQYHYQAWKQMADGVGVYFDEKINERLRGVSRMDSLEIILERYEGTTLSDQQKADLAEQKNTLYRELLSQMTPDDVTKEVRKTLDALRGKGLLLAIGSSSKNTKYILERTDLTRYFDAISDGANITRSKPDPEVFLKAAGYLEVDPKDCMVIEDAYAGIDAAKDGGMYAVGIGSAVGYERCDVVLSRFNEMLDYIEI